MTSIGVIFPPNVPPEQLRSVALAADESGVEELCLWEDCFKESGIACAAAVLAWTTRLHVGIGLLPVPLRNVAITAMELATLERLFPGRVLPGVGHGVRDWMAQVGARAESPMTLLGEYTTALRSLLHGGSVTPSRSCAATKCCSPSSLTPSSMPPARCPAPRVERQGSGPVYLASVR